MNDGHRVAPIVLGTDRARGLARTNCTIVPAPGQQSQHGGARFNPDGSVTLYLQSKSPGPDKEANWLPAPAGAFIPMLRMFRPKAEAPSILDGSWSPPEIVRSEG